MKSNWRFDQGKYLGIEYRVSRTKGHRTGSVTRPRNGGLGAVSNVLFPFLAGSVEKILLYSQPRLFQPSFFRCHKRCILYHLSITEAKGKKHEDRKGRRQKADSQTETTSGFTQQQKAPENNASRWSNLIFQWCMPKEANAIL
ncbi:hypothetical protein ACFE04_013608 [Oxalis oulophora]